MKICIKRINGVWYSGGVEYAERIKALRAAWERRYDK